MISGLAMQHRPTAQRAAGPAARMSGAGGADLHARGRVLNGAPPVQRLAAFRSGLRAPRRVEPVVQRRMDVTAINPVPALQAKVTTVENTLNQMGLAVAPHVEVSLEVIQDPDRVNTNPAVTRHLPPQLGLRQIRVRVRSWYIQSSSVGEIVALIGHELGVHTLANLELTRPERRAERAANATPYIADIAGAHRPLAPLGGAGDRRQADHVNVAKFARNAANVPTGPMPRMRQYIATMLRLGDAIGTAPGYADNAARLQARNALFQTFLFDMGRIIATDDGAAWAVATGVGDIAAVFNWLRNDIVAQHGAAHPWLLNVTIANATRRSLLGMLAGKAIGALWAQRGAIVRQAGRGIGALAGRAAGAARRGIRTGLGWLGF